MDEGTRKALHSILDRMIDEEKCLGSWANMNWDDEKITTTYYYLTLKKEFKEIENTSLYLL